MNILKLDTPNCRKNFIFTWLYLTLYVFLVSIFGSLIIYTIGITEITLPIFVILGGLFAIVAIYVSWLNYTKRLWDITGNKKDSIFYATAIWIANVSMAFIPFLSVVGTIFSVAVLILLFFKKGKRVQKVEVKENNEQ